MSTDEQTDSGLGLADQRHRIDAETDRRGWGAVDHRADEGVSGSVAPHRRPALAAILDEVRAGDTVVVAKLDRLSRSLLAFCEFVERARRGGWHVVALDVDVDMTTPSGQLVANVMASFAEYERQLIAERTRGAMQAAKRRGQRLGTPPAYPPAVRERVADLRADGWSYPAIAARFTAEGVPTARDGSRWHASTVWRIADSLRLDAEADAARGVAA